MGKQVFILNCASGNAGVAKIVSNGKKSNLTINLNKKFPEIKKCHIISGGNTVKSFDLRKNKNTFEFYGDIQIENLHLTTEKEDNIVVWTGDAPEKKELNPTPAQLHDTFNFESFFGGGFEWRRIRGNFIMYNYSILHYVISDNTVYQAINRAGYYTCGIKKEDDITFISIAIPVKTGSNPYEKINADVYTIKSGKTTFSVLCVGIDETGEFFVSI